ncbi:MAG: hypothetical protein C5B50_16650 [Verrucomicrobia bacterium]|nr:MAG: hypothetical protein C5B50_16650 [Verrucomicrobiota bacterium]
MITSALLVYMPHRMYRREMRLRSPSFRSDMPTIGNFVFNFVINFVFPLSAPRNGIPRSALAAAVGTERGIYAASRSERMEAPGLPSPCLALRTLKRPKGRSPARCQYRDAPSSSWRNALAAITLTAILPFSAQAGGSGLNTVVVINQASSNSCALGNYYCERRQIPPQNVLRISWPGPNTSWVSTDFQTNLLQPLLSMLASRQLTNQINYVVLSMDIPFQTVNGSTVNGTTSALFYGLKPDTNTASGYANSYALSEGSFPQAQPAYNAGYSFLATMITANSLTQAEQIVDQGVSADGALPTQPIILEKTDDPQGRNARYQYFDNAIFNAQVLGRNQIQRTNSDAPPSPTPVLGYQTGQTTFSVAPNSFVPGAIADNMTSFSGIIFGNTTGQTPILDFLAAGAAGSYGTVVEPSSDTQKFPNPLDYFYQFRGYALAESYYQSINDPYLGLIVGEPLSAPFAQPASGRWRGVASNAVLSATAKLPLSFTGKPGRPPLQQLDLFVDGVWNQTVTNLAPSAGNQLTVTLSGYPVSYTVPANTSLTSICTGLVAAINVPAVTNLTRIKAFAHGDRVELHSLSTNYSADPFYVLDPGAINRTASFYRLNYLPFPNIPALSTTGFDSGHTAFHWHIETAPGVPFVVLASTNLLDWSPVATNLLGGVQDFSDQAAASYPQRFFRVSAADQHPALGLAPDSTGTNLALHVQSQTSQAYTLYTSTNLWDWIPIATNQAGGCFDLLDPRSTNTGAHFYRAVVSPPALPPASLSILPAPFAAGNVIAVTGAARGYTIDVSSNQTEWASIFTNQVLTPGQVAAGSSIGNGPVLSTFLSASQPVVMDSPAFGLRQFAMVGTSRTNSWINLLITKTNGATVSVGVTNSSSNFLSLTALAQQLYAAVNASPALQGSDGVVAEDWSSSNLSFHLRAISPGYAAAGITCFLTSSPELGLSPGWSKIALNSNLSDLQPRNHLYVNAGAYTLAATINLDTTTLPDGYHELEAVAYDGSDVRTQARLILPVQIQNTPLSAVFSGLPDSGSAQATYQVQITANTNTVSLTSLFTTGGLLATVTNQPTATFTIDGSYLGLGLHPFYALVLTSDGLQYRTDTHWLRLQ